MASKTLRWNQKFLDYEIETWGLLRLWGRLGRGWNQKFLDYEIETHAFCILSIGLYSLLESKVSRLRD